MQKIFSVTVMAGFSRSGFRAPVMAIALSLALHMYAITGHAAAESGTPDGPKSLLRQSLEDLMNIEVTSAGRKPQRLSEAATAIHVISQEDIRRSGMTSIPELLRMVHGLNVAQFDANKWAISSRGFNDLYANKLLVLIDGRTVYSPLFSGVFWDVQDTPLEDIERIEVIRGPGGTLWGANAVNGVINIITKQAQHTQGGLVAIGGGALEHNGETLRYGGKFGDSMHYRVYGKHFDRTSFVDAAGRATNDAWSQDRGGFRVDREMPEGGALTLAGEAYSGRSGQMGITPSLAPPYTNAFAENTKVDGSHLRANYHRPLEGGADMSLQAYYDHTLRQTTLTSEKRDTYDLDFQHRLPWGGYHELNWGLGYRLSHDDTSSEASSLSFFTPASKTLHIYSAFAQNESTWMEDRLHFILGSKFEHNVFTGFEYQPNARLLWKTGENGALWAAVSRAVHTPSRGEAGVNIAVNASPTGITFPSVAMATLFGNPDLKSEKLIAYEAGWRDTLHQNLSVDTTVFYNDYRNFVTFETGAPYLDNTFSYLIVPLQMDNKAHGRVYGSEVALNWQAAEHWRLNGSFSLLRMHMTTDTGGNDASVPLVAGSNPRQQWQLHSYLDLPRNLSLDAAVYYVSSLPSQAVPAYTRLDLRLGWKPLKDMELSLAAQNLTGNHHPEFGSSIAQLGSQVPRTVYGKVTLRF